MKAQQNQKATTSFTFLNQIEDPNFVQYLETYCRVLDRREKENQQKNKKWNLFEDDFSEQNFNTLSNHLSRPSIGCLDLKGSACSLEIIPKGDRIKEENVQRQQHRDICKMEIENQEESSKIQVKREIGQNFIDEQWVKRLDQISSSINFVKDEVLQLMEYFDEQIIKQSKV